jgi:hypothetical protein
VLLYSSSLLFVLAISKLNMYVTFYVFQFYLERGAKDIINQSTLAVACVGLVSACLRVMSFCSGRVACDDDDQGTKPQTTRQLPTRIEHSPLTFLLPERGSVSVDTAHCRTF